MRRKRRRKEEEERGGGGELGGEGGGEGEEKEEEKEEEKKEVKGIRWEGVDCGRLTQDTNKWLSRGRHHKYSGCMKCRYFLARWGTLSYLGKCLLRGVSRLILAFVVLEICSNCHASH